LGYDMSTINYTGDGRVELANRTGANDAPDYFRLNIWGMATMRAIMARSGVMLSADCVWPEHPGDEHFDDDGEPLTPKGRAFRDAVEAVLRQSPEQGKVPFFKFGSNDGWVITPEECRALAAGLRAVVNGDTGEALSESIEQEKAFLRHVLDDAIPTVDRDEIEFWRRETLDFADFCERSAEHGEGFAVW
jgi:hypothetical protein